MLNPYFEEKDFVLHQGDCVGLLKSFSSESIDLIFADPPYFLSNGGVTCKAGKMVSVNKASWDKSNGFEKDLEFTFDWLSGCKRVLKEDGCVWVSGTMHNIYQVGFVLQKLGFKILNEVSWFKPNAPPNLSCRYFVHSHETILWAKKSGFSKHKFNYQELRDWFDVLSPSGKQMKSVWSIPLTPLSEKVCGKHPTQKPLELLKRIIVSSSNKGDLVLDPFVGSGTTGVVSKMLERRFVGIDKEKEYLDLAVKRVSLLNQKNV